MAKQNSVMEIGVLSSTRTEGNPFDKVAEHGVHVTQISNWNMELCTPEFGKKIKKMAMEKESWLICACGERQGVWIICVRHGSGKCWWPSSES